METANDMVESYVVEVLVSGEKKWNRNGLKFCTFKEADRYAQDLMGRWMLVLDYRVVESDEECNATWGSEGLCVVH